MSETPYTQGFRAGYIQGQAAGERLGIDVMLKVMGEEGFNATALGHLSLLVKAELEKRHADELDNQ